MIPAVKAKLLEGKKGLIVGIANENSIAWGCAKAFRAFGAEVAVTYLNDKAKVYVEPLAGELEAPIGQYLPVHRPQILLLGVSNHMLHHQPAKPVTLEVGADQDREFGTSACHRDHHAGGRLRIDCHWPQQWRRRP